MHREPTGAGPGRPDVPPPGWWPSPLAAADVAGAKVSRGALRAAGTLVTWTESRPAEGGRQVVVAVGTGDHGSGDGPAPAVHDISPPGVSVRARVHEYGGVAAVVLGDGRLLYVDQDDQSLCRWTPGGAGRPEVVVPSAPGRRLADPGLAPDGTWSVWVEEVVGAAATTHRLVTVDHGATGEPRGLVAGSDFVAAPRIDPSGTRLAWLAWAHPSMPWDSTTLRVARIVTTSTTGGGRSWTLADVEVVAGGPGVSVGQPSWLADGALAFVDDRTGWWLPYRRPRGGGAAVALLDMAGEFHGPDWTLGQATLAEGSDGSLVARLHAGGRDHLVRLVPPRPDDRDAAPWALVPVPQPCRDIAGVAVSGGPSGDRIWVLGSTDRTAQCVIEVDVEGAPGAGYRCVAPSGPAGPPVRPAPTRPFVARTPAGPVPGLVVLPVAPSAVGRPPPLVVFCHGGPTSAVQAGYDPVAQFFATRGLAVALVDYRGSSGYGRAYRRALEGTWGEADRDDCVGYALALADAGLVDGDRMAVRGSSAGGLTALRALQAPGGPFAGAVSWYGVTDLRALVAETHDFEARYLDGLVGPWPGASDRYLARSPISAPEAVRGEVLLFQGTEDRVVPLDQAESFAAALDSRGVPCRLVTFPGEGHGFRRAETIEACLTAELDFYRHLFAPAPSGDAG